MLSNKTAHQKAMLALIWVSVFWGTTWLAGKIGLNYMPALQLIGFRQLIGGLLFLVFFLFKRVPLPKGKQWQSIIILSILNFVLSNGLLLLGVKYISSGLGAIIGAIFPLWLVLLSLLEGKKISILSLAGMIVGFLGVCIIFFDHLKDFLQPAFRLGIILSLISSLSWAFGTLYTKKKSTQFNPYFSLGFQMSFSGFFFCILAYATHKALPLSLIPVQAIWSITYLVIIGSVFTFAAFIYALKNLPVSLTSIYAYINPIIAVILGAMVLNEKMTWYIVFGGALTLSGVYLVNRSFKPREN